MPALTVEEIQDLITTTTKDFGEFHWEDISRDLQEYFMMKNIMKKHKVGFSSGTSIQKNVQVTTNGAASNVGMYGTDDVSVSDVMKTINVPWRHTSTNYAFEQREFAMNKGARQILDLIKVRRLDAHGSKAEKMEQNGWTAPTSSTDELSPFGIPYWIVANTTEGFNGGNPSGFSAGAGGLDSATYTNWRNWTAQFANITKDDCVKKMRKAFTHIKFTNPVNIPEYGSGSDRYGIYMGYDTLAEFEEIAEQQNDKLGKDIASMDGKTVFRGVAMDWVPQLDSSALTDPMYFVNWRKMNPVFLEGWYMREHPPKEVAGQHTTLQSFVDTTWNLVCCSRRHQALVYGGG